jgi:hypothetical protein
VVRRMARPFNLAPVPRCHAWLSSAQHRPELVAREIEQRAPSESFDGGAVVLVQLAPKAMIRSTSASRVPALVREP